MLRKALLFLMMTAGLVLVVVAGVLNHRDRVRAATAPRATKVNLVKDGAAPVSDSDSPNVDETLRGKPAPAFLLKDLDGPNVERERRTVGFEPTVVADFDAVLARIDKIVAPSDDPALLDRVETELRAAVAGAANVERSQAYYIDVTHPLANKGDAVRAIAAGLGIELAHTIVIGDMPNDMAMFRVAGFAIAMGQSPAQVQAAANAVTAANTDDGFAKAVTALVIPRLGGAQAP